MTKKLERPVWMDDGGMIWIEKRGDGFVVVLDGEDASLEVLEMKTARAIVAAYDADGQDEAAEEQSLEYFNRYIAGDR